VRPPRALESLAPAETTIPAAPPPPAPVPERWGDDSDAPTPEIHLRADTPVEAADPDGEQLFLDEDGADLVAGGTLVNVAGVKLSPMGKIHDVDAGDASYARGEQVIIESDRGPQLATVAIPTRREQTREPLRRVVRRADARDVAAAGRFVDRARDALRVAKERVRARRMAIKMFKVDVQPGGGKALVYFSSEERIDFRDLVRDLTHELKLRVEMRQTGVRDEAKLVGGIGSCGRELCCSTFLPHFEPVSIKMAKDQGLVLNPTKVSGQCGRLKCCLVYEQATYQEMRKGLPKLGKRVTTPAGEGRVAEVDVLRRRVRVSYAPGEFQTFEAEQVASVTAAASTSGGASTSMASRSLPPPAPPAALPPVPPDDEPGSAPASPDPPLPPGDAGDE
jgi:cell fate regulator YaaT (PSP1 superfamily)